MRPSACTLRDDIPKEALHVPPAPNPYEREESASQLLDAEYLPDRFAGNLYLDKRVTSQRGKIAALSQEGVAILAWEKVSISSYHIMDH